MDNLIDEGTPVRILLADDHQLVLDGIQLLLSRSDQYQITHAASNGVEALEYLDKHHVDLLLTDISMPQMDGIELTKRVKEKFPDVKVIVLSMHGDTSLVSEVIMAEAEGYILKNTGRKELEAAIKKVCGGGTYYSEDIVAKIIAGLRIEKSADPRKDSLTDREIEILQLVCDELTTHEIAEKLFISPKTVDTHRKNILKKTGVKTIVGLVKFAIANEIAAARD